MTSLPMSVEVASALPMQLQGVSMAAAGMPGGAAPELAGAQLPAGFREFLLANLQAFQGQAQPGQGLQLPAGEAASPEVLEAYLQAVGVEALPPGGKALPPGMVLSKLIVDPETPDGEIGLVGDEPGNRAHPLLALLAGAAEEGEEGDLRQQTLMQLLRRMDGDAAALPRGVVGQTAGQAQAVVDAAPDAARAAETPAVVASARTETAAAARPAVPLNVDVPVARPGWDQAVGNRVLWMVNNDTQAAQIKLNPPHLGPLDVRVSIEGDKAHVSFTAQHAPVRDALDAAIPRLREMLAESGLSLGDVNVSQQGPGGSGNGAQARGEGGGLAEEDVAGEDEKATLTVTGEGLIDYYA